MTQLNAFRDISDNLLSCDGIANYYAGIFSQQESLDIYMRLLSQCHWQNDRVIMYGKTIVTRRKTALYGNTGSAYAYSGVKRYPLPFTPLLLELKSVCEQHSGSTFNACLLNYYHDGADGMSWHSDDEKALGTEPRIASLSFGAGRRFMFRHKTKPLQTEIVLENGSMLYMHGPCQHYWKHSLPKSAAVKQGRINLTFRTILI